MGCVNTMCKYDADGCFGKGGDLPPATPIGSTLGFPVRSPPLKQFLGPFPRNLETFNELQQGSNIETKCISFLACSIFSIDQQYRCVYKHIYIYTYF